MTKEVPDSLKQFIRAVLISSSGGVQQTRFLSEYRKYTGSAINVYELGFKNLYEFLLAIPDVARVEYSPKHAENVIFGVTKRDVYASDHARKAANKTTGLAPRPPSEWGNKKVVYSGRNTSISGSNKFNLNSPDRKVNVPDDLSTLRITVDSAHPDVRLCPNDMGWYGVHISNLAANTTKEDIERVFSPCGHLCEAKVINTPGSKMPIAFAKYAKHDDALVALQNLDGKMIKGNKIKVKPATDRNKVKSMAFWLKEGKHLLELHLQNLQEKFSSLVPQTSPRQDKNVVDDKVANQAAASKQTFHARHTGYPVHVLFSNPLPHLTEVEISQLFSLYGTATNIVLHERYAVVSFEKAGEVAAVLQQREFLYNNTILRVKPWKDGEQEEHDTPGSPSSMSSFDTGHSRKNSSGSSSSFGSWTEPSSPKTRLSLCNSTDTGDGAGGNNKESLAATHSSTASQQSTRTVTGLTSKQEIICGSPSAQVTGQLQGNAHVLLTRDQMELFLKSCGQPGLNIHSTFPDEFDILVTEIVGSCHFWAIISDGKDNWTRLEELKDKLQTIKPRAVEPQKYMLGAGRFSEDNLWYRCFTLDVSPDKQRVKVLYADYGNAEWLSAKDFSSLDKSLWDLSPQAIPLKLAGLEPTAPPGVPSGSSGALHLSDLICNKACRAKKCPNTDPVQPHVLEVEVSIDNISVNAEMEASNFVKKSPVVTPVVSPKPAVKKMPRIPIRITWVESAELIHYQDMRKEAIDGREYMDRLLRGIPFSAKMFPQPGLLACYSEGNSRFRVRIQDVIGGYTGPIFHPMLKAKVFRVDTGQTDLVGVEQLLTLVPPLAKFPFQARAGLLVGTRPPGSLHPGHSTGKRLLVSKRFELLHASILKRYKDYDELMLFDGEADLNAEVLEQERRLLNRSTSSLSVSSNNSDKSDHSVEASTFKSDEDWDTESTKGLLPTPHPYPKPQDTSTQGAQIPQSKIVPAPSKGQNTPSVTSSQPKTPGFYMPPPPTETANTGTQEEHHTHVTPGQGHASPLPFQAAASVLHRVSPPLTVSSVRGGRGINLTSPPQTASNIYNRRPGPPAASQDRMGVAGGAGVGGSAQAFTGQHGASTTATSNVVKPSSEAPIYHKQLTAGMSGDNKGSNAPRQESFGESRTNTELKQGDTTDIQKGFGILSTQNRLAPNATNISAFGVSQQGFGPGTSQGVLPRASGHQNVCSSTHVYSQGKGTPGEAARDVSSAHRSGQALADQIPVEETVQGLSSFQRSQQHGTGESAHTHYSSTKGHATEHRKGDQEENWDVKKKELLKRLESQKSEIQALEEEIKKPRESDLVRLKRKLGKQVRITELENKVIPMRNKIEELEAQKAKLQLELLNS